MTKSRNEDEGIVGGKGCCQRTCTFVLAKHACRPKRREDTSALHSASRTTVFAPDFSPRGECECFFEREEGWQEEVQEED